jgi:polar amino acid transport system permease protein
MDDLMIIWGQRTDILTGLVTTIEVLAVSSVAALALGALVTPALMSPRKWLAKLASWYVDSMRCAPFLLFLYLIYFGLPILGLQLSSWSSGVIALVAYNAAYMAELLAAAWKRLPANMIEAAQAYGFSGFKLVHRIILPPVMTSALPMIGNQMLQIVKDSAFLTIIAVGELTHQMNSIQSTYFIPFAAFLTAVVLYWGICLVIEIGNSLFARRTEEKRA